MKSKSAITVISLLVAFLFIGTAMTSAFAGSTTNTESQQTSSSTGGCPLCANQESSDGLKLEEPFDCDEYMLNAAITVGFAVLEVISDIIQNVDYSKVYELMQKGKSMLQAIVIVILEIIENNQDLIQTIMLIVAGAIQSLIDTITDLEVLQFIASIIISVGITTTTFVIANLPAIIAAVLFGLGVLEEIAEDLGELIDLVWDAICDLICPPDEQDASADSQELMQSASQSTQQSSVSSTSVVTQSTVTTTTTQQSSAVSSQSTPTVTQTTVAPTTSTQPTTTKTGSTSTLSRR